MSCDVFGNIVSRKLPSDVGKVVVQVSGTVMNMLPVPGNRLALRWNSELYPVGLFRRTMSRRGVHQKLRRFTNYEEIPLGTDTQIPGGVIWGESRSGRGSGGNATACGEGSGRSLLKKKMGVWG